MDLLERWLDQLEEAKALIDGRESTAARLEGWLPWLEPAADDDEAAQSELMRIVALDARNLAQEGRAASVVVAQPLLLASAWPDHRGAKLSQLLVRVAADAHTLGTVAAKEAKFRALVGRAAPVVPLGDRWLGYLIGPMAAEVIDGVLGRLLSAAAGAGRTQVALDIAGAEPPNDVFVRTLSGFTATNTGSVERLTITGVTDPDALAAQLKTEGVPSAQIRIQMLEAWLNEA